jgi:hypothetical protein
LPRSTVAEGSMVCKASICNHATPGVDILFQRHFQTPLTECSGPMEASKLVHPKFLKCSNPERKMFSPPINKPILATRYLSPCCSFVFNPHTIASGKGFDQGVRNVNASCHWLSSEPFLCGVAVFSDTHTDLNRSRQKQKLVTKSDQS